MNYSSLQDIYQLCRPYLSRQYALNGAIACLVVSGVISSGVSLIFFTQLDQVSEVPVETIIQTSEEEEVVPLEILVDISGAVESPGMVKLEGEARLSEVIEKAGGFSKKADKEFLAKQLNLAQKVQDGQKIFIPAEGDSVVLPETPQTPKDGNAIGGSGFTLNINTASLEELDTLSGIGETRAKGIIENRPYQSTQELVEKKVVSQSTHDSIKDQISAQ